MEGNKGDIERGWEEGRNLWEEEEEKGGTEKAEEEKVPGKGDRGKERINEDKKGEDKGMRKEIKRRKENSPSSWHLPDTHKLYPSKSLNNIVST